MPLKTSRKKQKLGDCYEAAFKFLMNECMIHSEKENNFALVHAEVMGQGQLEGVSYGHAFVIDTTSDTVIDVSNGRNIKMGAGLYFAIGGIDYLNNIHKYTWPEASRKAVLTGTYGPWDLITKTGL